MMEWLTIISTIVLFVILLIKGYNVATGGKRFDIGTIMLLFTIGILFYGLFQMNFLGSISYKETSTIIDGASTITVTQNNNLYEYNLPFSYLLNGIMWMITGITFVETVMVIFPKTRGRYSPKNKEK